jgi:hypothetical protein
MRRSIRTLIGTSTAAAAVAASLSIVVAAGTPAAASAAPEFKMPKVYGTTFQADPGHDFTKGIKPRRDGILRGWITHYQGGVAEYQPIKWVRGKHGDDGRFAGPPEYVVMSYASKISGKAALYSKSGCKPVGHTVTVDKRGLGTKRCSRKTLVSHLKTGRIPAMITVHRGQIIKIQEINHP